jgi:putative spermidine/putrescine transport system substrate-binding protein
MLRRTFGLALLAATTLLGATACAGGGTSAEAAWSAPYDQAKIPAQVASFQTYGLPDDWANYGELVQAFCKKHGAAKCEHKDTDMSSAEEIQRFDVEKGNPIGTISDIGALWGAVAEAKGVVPHYLPPNADALKPEQKAATGGWVNTFAGVPSFTVNTDVVADPPRTWSDLLKPEYKGMISIPNDGGSNNAMVVAAAIALGGSAENLQPAFDFFAKLKDSGNLTDVDASSEALARGDIGVWVQYDFLGVTAREELKADHVAIDVVIPSDGSVFAPSSLMINAYNEDKMDFTKAFLDFALSDEGQILFAKFGARPIRYINGDLEIPADARKLWLPDEAYRAVKTIDWSALDTQEMVAAWESNVLS